MLHANLIRDYHMIEHLVTCVEPLVMPTCTSWMMNDIEDIIIRMSWNEDAAGRAVALLCNQYLMMRFFDDKCCRVGTVAYLI